MVATWALVALFAYPLLQVPALWLVVRYFGLRNDDGPRDPFGYTVHEAAESPEHPEGHCAQCGGRNQSAATYCRQCLSELG